KTVKHDGQRSPIRPCSAQCNTLNKNIPGEYDREYRIGVTRGIGARIYDCGAGSSDDPEVFEIGDRGAFRTRPRYGYLVITVRNGMQGIESWLKRAEVKGACRSGATNSYIVCKCI